MLEKSLFYCPEEFQDEQKNENCCICLEPLSNNTIVKTRCNHLFHKKCMHNYLACDENNLDCPLCRIEIGHVSITIPRYYSNSDSDNDSVISYSDY